MARIAPAVAVAVLAVLAGCSDGGTATPARPAGSAATVPSDAATEAGYTPDGSTEITVNTTLRADLEGDIEVREFVDVVATVPVSRYRRSTDGGPAVVAVAASPEVQVIEDPSIDRDPLSALSTARLVGAVQQTYDASDLSETGRREVTLLGTETDLVTYRGRARLTENGTASERPAENRTVAVHVARAAHDGDVVTVVAVGPAGRPDADRVAMLVAAVTH